MLEELICEGTPTGIRSKWKEEAERYSESLYNCTPDMDMQFEEEMTKLRKTIHDRGEDNKMPLFTADVWKKTFVLRVIHYVLPRGKSSSMSHSMAVKTREHAHETQPALLGR